ncbi:unnamed protein product [marine sediment metagenome]|uniref:Secreted protein n=1 Tax=marine sediment metagenome TaxID=412755 RepID=X0TNR4_9ZZZZ
MKLVVLFLVMFLLFLSVSGAMLQAEEDESSESSSGEEHQLTKKDRQIQIINILFFVILALALA